MTQLWSKRLDRLVQEQRERIETIEAELKDVRRRLDRLWNFVESTDDDLARTATPRIGANKDQQARLEASLQEANAILVPAQVDPGRCGDHHGQDSLDMTEYPEESELPERKAFVQTFVRDIVVMPGKATIHYKVPIAKDSPNPKGTPRSWIWPARPSRLRVASDSWHSFEAIRNLVVNRFGAKE